MCCGAGRQGRSIAKPLPHLPSRFLRVFGPLSTEAVLSDPALVQRLAEEGQRSLDWLEGITPPVARRILERSLEFSHKSAWSPMPA